MNFKVIITIVMLATSLCNFAQSDIEKVLKGGEILVNGLSFFKSSKINQKSSNSKLIESICIKNKLADKISFNFVGKNDEGVEIKKEMVIPKDGKECIFDIPKGVYGYEVILANREVYKKGEYRFIEEVTILIKGD